LVSQAASAAFVAAALAFLHTGLELHIAISFFSHAAAFLAHASAFLTYSIPLAALAF